MNADCTSDIKPEKIELGSTAHLSDESVIKNGKERNECNAIINFFNLHFKSEK